MQTVKIGTTTYKVKDDLGREEAIMLLDARARVIPSPKRFQAWVASRKDPRDFPHFTPGDSVEKYVTDYYVLNQERLTGSIYGNASLKSKAATELITKFFEPLSTLPMFAPSGDAIEETNS